MSSHSSAPLDDTDVIEIEVVESPSHRPTRQARQARSARALPDRVALSRRQLVAVTVAVTVVVTVVVVSLLVWQPWRPQPPAWRTYPVATRFPPSLTGRLVFDQPPGDIFQASVPDAPLATAVTRSTLVGHVFARPGSIMRSDPWLSFSTLPSYSAAEPTTSALTVRGTDATIDRAESQATVEWGPLERRSWTASGGSVDDARLLEFAEAVGIVDDQPALRGSYDLEGMEPLGGIEGFRTVLTVQRTLDQAAPVVSVRPTVVRYRDGGEPLSLISLPAPPDTLAFVPFVLNAGGLVEEVTIRSNPGVALSAVGGDNLISWLEGGRLVVVAGPQPLDELLAWALGTRAATDQEWLDVGDRLTQTVEVVAEGAEVGAGVTPNGNSWQVLVSRSSNSTAFCLVTVNGEACTMTTGMERPPLDDWFVEGGRVAVRFSTTGQPTVARLTAPDGTVTELDFVTVDRARTAVAVFVATGTTLELLAN